MDNWIKVTENLPQGGYGSRYLAYGTPLCGSCGNLPIIQFCSYSQRSGFEFGEYDCELDATHWMSLPDVPS